MGKESVVWDYLITPTIHGHIVLGKIKDWTLCVITVTDKGCKLSYGSWYPKNKTKVHDYKDLRTAQAAALETIEAFGSARRICLPCGKQLTCVPCSNSQVEC